jgi:SAM-dependent methyltransferase
MTPSPDAVGGSWSDAASAPQAPGSRPSDRIDTSVPHPARRYNYWLGGKDHFAADRASADEIAKMVPSVRIGAQQNRKFQRRVVQFLTREEGIHQFLDIGTGIPAPDNTHEVAQAIDPSARVVYVDNDPIVLTHARALLTSTSEGKTAYIDADVREPGKIMDHPDTLSTLDFSKPVGLLLIAILHFLVDDEEPYRLVSNLVRRLAPGSFVVISHATQEYMPAEQLAQVNAAAASGRHGQFRLRDSAEVTRFFDGLDIVAPGVVCVADWHPDSADGPIPAAEDVAALGAVARIP